MLISHVKSVWLLLNSEIPILRSKSGADQICIAISEIHDTKHLYFNIRYKKACVTLPVRFFKQSQFRQFERWNFHFGPGIKDGSKISIWYDIWTRKSENQTIPIVCLVSFLQEIENCCTPSLIQKESGYFDHSRNRIFRSTIQLRLILFSCLN